MKSLSCISLSKTREDPPDRLDLPIDPYKDNTKTAVLGYSKGPKIQTLVEVLRCELARPGRSSTTTAENGLVPSKQWTPLYYAVYHNRDAALLHFLRAGHSPDGVATIGQPPLCIAVAAGNAEIVKILCEANANTKAACEHNGETPLHLAIKAGRNDILETLLRYEPDLYARTLYTGETPLHYAAAKSGSLAAVVALLKQGANYEALNTKGNSPAAVALQTPQNLPSAVAIISAARGRRNKLAKEKEMLLKHVEKAQNRFSMNNELIADIFEAGCDPDSTVLVEAIKRDDSGLVEMFLEKGADPNRATATGILPIFAALNCSGAQVVRSLVMHKADVTLRDPHGSTTLQAALESHSAHDQDAISGIFESLLEHGANPQVRYTDGTTLLHHVVRPGLELARVAKQLLKHGVKVNKRDGQGNTALHAACHSKSCIAMLLTHGADANIVNLAGLSPLLQATKTAARDEEPDLEQLIKCSDVRQVDSSGTTALHFAAQNGLDKTIRSLLQARAETTSIDSKNRTPLLLAVYHQQWAIVPLLAIQPGMNSWDENGLTALHHISISQPKHPAKWADISSAASPFCEKGVSRSMRDKSGATPLIKAVKALPQEGLPVVEVLLSCRASERSNCVGHEDHKQRSALYYAATLGKPAFVEALLKHGAPFTLKDWKSKKAIIRPTSAISKQILKLISEHEWLRRMTTLKRLSSPVFEEAIFPSIVPLGDLEDLLSMGLNANTLPKSNFAGTLLWVLLNQTLLPPPLPPQYLHDALQIILLFGANPNAPGTRESLRSSQARGSQQVPATYHALTFLLEQYPSVDIDLITMLLNNGAKLSTSSSFYDGRNPLHSAVRSNRIDVVAEFLSRKVNPNCTDSKQRTPLFIAAEKGYWEILELMLSFGAKANTKDNEGNTPLHAAVIGGSTSILSSLLRAGAKSRACNLKGSTPLGLVSEKVTEREKIVAILKHAEDRERDEEASKGKALERSAIEEGKQRLAREREVKKQKSNPSMKTASASRRKPWPGPTSQVAVSPALTSPLIPAAQSTVAPPANKKSASSRKPLITAPKRFTKKTVNVQYALPIAKPQQPSPAPKLVANAEKPLPQPRVDSGVNFKQTAEQEKPLPILDRNKTNFDKAEKKSEHGDEIASWLALSKMMDRL